MTVSKIVAAAFCSAALAVAASVDVSGPVSAVVFDARGHSIRLVTGAPGASILGSTLVDRVEAAEIAPNGNAAIVMRGGQFYAVSGLTSANPSWARLATNSLRAVPRRGRSSGAAIERVVWNRDSSAAAVYLPAAHKILVVSGDGSVLATLPVDSLAGDVTALALETSSPSAIAAVAGGVYLLTPQNPPALLASLARPTAAYLIQDGDLLVADADTLQILEISDYHGARQLLPFANLPAGASNPVGIAMSPDAQVVFAADQACRCISFWQFSTRGLVNSLALEVEPAFLKPVSLGRQFLVNSPNEPNSPFWMLNAGGTPAVFFVSNGAQ